jgi:uncharacterized protein (DUF302 family)
MSSKELETMKQPLSFDVTLETTFEDGLQRVTDALKAEGFGVLTRVDIDKAFKEKLDKDFHPYAILGACNPPLAHKALCERPEAGLMLPCNVTVEEVSGGRCVVRIINPEAMMEGSGLSDDPVLNEVGQEAKERLARVAETLARLGSSA